MRVNVFPAAKLPPVFDDRWREWQRSDPAFMSPYFRPEFTRAVARVRDDVFVAVIEDGEAFFAFQRRRFGVGVPVGGVMSDYHGVVARPGFSFDARELVRRCGLSVWNFHFVPAAQKQFEPWHRSQIESSFINLARGPVGSKHLRQNLNNASRRLERAIGPLELEMNSTDPEGLRQVLAWKSAQYLRTHVGDLFSHPWARNLLELINASREDIGFAGILSILRAGGREVAAHFGMRSRGVLHYWFPAYDVELSDFSPGMLLLKAMTEAGAEHGLETIDFGPGGGSYKQRFATEAIPLLGGSVVAAPWVEPFRNAIQPIRTLSRPLRRRLNELRHSHA
jgi:CelD/BcsL family acetyltransferase involved in cellulose biosynthesis